jgi:chemotaxis-related protein WspD
MSLNPISLPVITAQGFQIFADGAFWHDRPNERQYEREHCWEAIGVYGDRACPELPKHTHCRNCPVFASAGLRLFDRDPPPGYTNEWAETIAKADVPPDFSTIPVLLFRVADEWLALHVRHTVEVAPVKTIRHVPHLNDDVFAGLVNIRGELQPAISLKKLMQINDAEKSKPDPNLMRLLVVTMEGVLWVFVVDEVFDIRHLLESQLGHLPGTVGSSPSVYTQGVFRWEGKAVGYIDTNRIFAALKRSFR